MRALLILIVILCFGIAGLAVLSRVAVKSEQIDMRAELSHSIATAQPPVDALLDNHASRIGRFGTYWTLAGALAALAAVAALTCLGLSLRRRGSDVA